MAKRRIWKVQAAQYGTAFTHATSKTEKKRGLQKGTNIRKYETSSRLQGTSKNSIVILLQSIHDNETPRIMKELYLS